MKAILAGSPPISPDAADQIARLLEIRHIEGNYSRLPDWDRHSPSTATSSRLEPLIDGQRLARERTLAS